MYLQEEARCPYCDAALNKPPQRKTNCPSCRQAFYVRTRPSDQRKVIVTEQEADAIDQEWALRHQLGDPADWEQQLRTLSSKNDPYEKAYYQAMLARSRRQYDQAWAFFNEARIQAAGLGQFGIYRNITFDMANQLRIEGKHEHAVIMLCEVCFYDLCGASNAVLSIEGNRRVPWNSGWDPEFRELAPGVVQMVRDWVEELGMAQEALRSIILEHLTRIHGAMNLPLSPEAALPLLLKVAYGTEEAHKIKPPLMPKKAPDRPIPAAHALNKRQPTSRPKPGCAAVVLCVLLALSVYFLG